MEFNLNGSRIRHKISKFTEEQWWALERTGTKRLLKKEKPR